MELHEQHMFGLPAPGRSHYHPETLLYEVWQKPCSDDQHRRQLESDGYRFNLMEKAVAIKGIDRSAVLHYCVAIMCLP